MTRGTISRFGRRSAARGEPDDRPPLAIRYRLSPLASLGIGLGFLVMIAVFALMLAHPEWADRPAEPGSSHRGQLIFDLLHALPPAWRPVAILVLGVQICAVILLFLKRTSDNRPDFVIDRRGVVEIGLFSRSRAAWDQISHITIHRRGHRWPDFWAPSLRFYLEPGEVPIVEGVNPLVGLIHRFGRPQLTLSLRLSDRSEEEIVSYLRSLRPTLPVHDLG
jgi:hypothetical protein